MRKENQCVFCQGLEVSKEHFWPSWMGSMLSEGRNGSHIHKIQSAEGKAEFRTVKLKKLPGDITTKKIRAVCAKCNNGWMSTIEKRIKPLMLRILGNECFSLSTIDQELLAQWITLKVIVAEHSEGGTNVTPVDDRKIFMERRIIPEYFSIYIGRCEDLLHAGFMRYSGTMAFSQEGPKPLLQGLSRNMQSISFACKSLVVQVFSARIEDFWVDSYCNLSPLLKIHPNPSMEIKWPLNHTSQTELNRIFFSLQRFVESDNVVYAGPT